jgi:Asp-tRNA(Asn)/Glu-tRNA(Gln) amidotransferase A subunit family amidase
MSLNLESAAALVGKMKAGEISSEDVVRDCLRQIEASEGVVKAWAFLDAELALEQARALDELRRRGRPLGPLHGIPVGVKDIYDTADMPTEYGSPIHAGRRPATDCAAVAKLREAGAVIMGKTVTAEFAFLSPGETTNPHNPAHTPGGSSSGSAAAVAAAHVPLAVGSQTNGSVVRPASFCGVYGLKPSEGMLSRHGVLQTSETLDQLGVFARTLEDIALISDAMTGFDDRDATTYARPKPNFSAGFKETVPAEPAFAWFDLPFADRLSEDAAEGFAELLDTLDGRVRKFQTPPLLDQILAHHRIVHFYEVRRNLAVEYENDRERISPALLEVFAEAKKISDDQYHDALATVAAGKEFFVDFFEDFDAIVTPSSAGEALSGLDSTGDPIFSTIWTMCGLPSLSMPLMTGAQDLPIGVQLVAGIEEDDRLCRTANWLLDYLSEES